MEPWKRWEPARYMIPLLYSLCLSFSFHWEVPLLGPLWTVPQATQGRSSPLAWTVVFAVLYHFNNLKSKLLLPPFCLHRCSVSRYPAALRSAIARLTVDLERARSWEMVCRGTTSTPTTTGIWRWLTRWPPPATSSTRWIGFLQTEQRPLR